MVYKQTEQGSTLVEVLIAITVVTLVLVTSISGLTLVTRNRRFSTQEALSTKYNQESLEWFRRQRDVYGWGSFYSQVQATATMAGAGQIVTYCLPSILPQTTTLQNICSVGECYPSEATCENNFTVQGEVMTRKLVIDLINTTQADQVNATAKISWNDGDNIHISEATLKLRKWQ